jgi:hypothetical protein
MPVVTEALHGVQVNNQFQGFSAVQTDGAQTFTQAVAATSSPHVLKDGDRTGGVCTIKRNGGAVRPRFRLVRHVKFRLAVSSARDEEEKPGTERVAIYAYGRADLQTEARLHAAE